MKKILATLLAILMVFTLVGCKNQEDNFYGTWDFVKISDPDGNTYTKEQLEEMGSYEFSSFRMVFQEGGKAQLFMQGEKVTANWEKTDNGVKVIAYNEIQCVYEDGLLYFEIEGGFVYFSKTSNSQIAQAPQNS